MVSLFFALVKSQESINERLSRKLKGLQSKTYYFNQSITYLIVQLLCLRHCAKAWTYKDK